MVTSMFDRSEILRTAWVDYRRDQLKGWGIRRGEPFNRKHFAYCLRMAWAVAKEVAARATIAPVAQTVANVCTDPARADAIRLEIRDMEMGDFINWARHAALGAELVRLSA